MTPPLRYKHVMIDIETMGTSHSAPVMAVGIVPFQLHREQCAVSPRELHREMRMSLQANIDAYRDVDGDAVEWWLRQSDAARAALLREPRLGSALELAEHLVLALRAPHLDPDELHVWAKPPQFDLEILRNLLEGRSVAWPCSLRLERDSRPLIDLAKVAGWEDCFPAPAVEHDALSDAVEQAEQVVRIWRRVQGWREAS